MTPQERQLIDDLFGRLSKLEGSPRDPDAVAAMAQGLRSAPNAVYTLVQTVLLQDEALQRANHRIQELEAADQPGQQQQPGGFLDSMRDTIFGQGQSHGSVPNVPPPGAGSRPVWNSGQTLQQGQYNQAPYNQGSYGQPYGGPGQPYGGPQGPVGAAMGGGGSSFLGTAAAAAAGTIGGSLLLNSIRGMMGGSHAGFGDPTTVINEKVINESPWGGDQSRSDLARDAGVNDINSADSRSADNSRNGLFDNTSDDDRDDMDLDSDDFGNDDGGNDGGSDYV
jgi:uncharacterized protein